jgi:hypothetical protein
MTAIVGEEDYIKVLALGEPQPILMLRSLQWSRAESHMVRKRLAIGRWPYVGLAILIYLCFFFGHIPKDCATDDAIYLTV